jgi:hypothetical protein
MRSLQLSVNKTFSYYHRPNVAQSASSLRAIQFDFFLGHPDRGGTAVAGGLCLQGGQALPADLRGPEEEEIFHKQPGRSRIEIMSPLVAYNH